MVIQLFLNQSTIDLILMRGIGYESTSTYITLDAEFIQDLGLVESLAVLPTQGVMGEIIEDISAPILFRFHLSIKSWCF